MPLIHSNPRNAAKAAWRADEWERMMAEPLLGAAAPGCSSATSALIELQVTISTSGESGDYIHCVPAPQPTEPPNHI